MRKLLEKEIQSISGGYYFGFCAYISAWHPNRFWHAYTMVFDKIDLIRQECCDVQHGVAWAYSYKINTKSEDQIKIVLLGKNTYSAANGFIFNEAIELKMRHNIDNLLGDQDVLGWKC